MTRPWQAWRRAVLLGASGLVAVMTSSRAIGQAAIQDPASAPEALPQEVAEMRRLLVLRQMSPAMLHLLKHGVPELTTVPATRLSPLQRLLLAQATGLPENQLGSFRWVAFGSAPADSAGHRTALTVWPGGGTAAVRPVVVTVDGAGRWQRR
jgi:hypothetical protein